MLETLIVYGNMLLMANKFKIDPDYVPSFVLRNFAENLYAQSTKLYNLSVISGYFLLKRKKSFIISFFN